MQFKEEIIKEANQLIEDANKKRLGFEIIFLDVTEDGIKVALGRNGLNVWKHFLREKPNTYQQSIKAGVDILKNHNVIDIEPHIVTFSFSRYLSYDEKLDMCCRLLVSQWEENLKICELKYIKGKLSKLALSKIKLLHEKGMIDVESLYNDYLDGNDTLPTLIAILDSDNRFFPERHPELFAFIELKIYDLCDFCHNVSFDNHLTFMSNSNTHIMHSIIEKP